MNNPFFISNNGKDLDGICPGFFMDENHLRIQFEYLTDGPSLNKDIEKNLRPFLSMLIYNQYSNYIRKLFAGHMEMFCKTVGDSSKFNKKLEDIEIVCEHEFQGSTLLRDLHIMVYFSEINTSIIL